jgi:hypothetical protein
MASERMKYDSAHDPELLKALRVVENFLKAKKRVCYGGTAMNAILPPSKQFYNPVLDLPDYDFFTPEMDDDIEDLVALLRKSGFKEIYHKVGIHEGTKKILVVERAVHGSLPRNTKKVQAAVPAPTIAAAQHIRRMIDPRCIIQQCAAQLLVGARHRPLDLHWHPVQPLVENLRLETGRRTQVHHLWFRQG